MDGVTFQPSVKRKKRKKLGKYVDPKKYLNPDLNSVKYSEKFKRVQELKSIQKEPANVIKRLHHHSKSIRCLSNRKKSQMKKGNGSKSFSDLKINSFAPAKFDKLKKPATRKGKIFQDYMI